MTTSTAASAIPDEHPTFLRKDWRAAAFKGGTDLGYQDWVAAQVERGTTGWLDAEAMRKLKPGTRVVAQVHETVETGTDRCALSVYPGDILRVLDIETRGGGLQVTIRVEAADAEYEEVVTDFDDEERGGLFPFSRPHVTRFAPPWPGDRLFDATASGDDPPDLTIAALHEDQSGLARGFYRVLDQRGGVHLCGRHDERWALSRNGQRVHDPALDVALKILGRKPR